MKTINEGAEPPKRLKKLPPLPVAVKRAVDKAINHTRSTRDSKSKEKVINKIKGDGHIKFSINNEMKATVHQANEFDSTSGLKTTLKNQITKYLKQESGYNKNKEAAIEKAPPKNNYEYRYKAKLA